MENPDPFHSDLTAEDRRLCKSLLNWNDECDERAKFHTESLDGAYGLILTYPIAQNQFIIDVECSRGMRHSEHFYYKVTAKEETIESQLLTLEQYAYYPVENEDNMDLKAPKRDPKGEFVRFTDSLAYGVTLIPEEITPKVILFDPHSSVLSCGLYTAYDVSGVSPKVSEFRAKIFCRPEEDLPIEKWKPYSDQERAKWRVVPNSQREDWKSSPPPQFETRCGWFSDSMSSSISLYDREGKWDIKDKWGYIIQGELDRPVFTPEQKMKTKWRDEYGCVCMDVKVSRQSNRILEIKNTRVQSLDVCRRDPGLK
ncbi:MAG: DUF4087 domain-containing protein, partial [Desulfatitalea sp.]